LKEEDSTKRQKVGGCGPSGLLRRNTGQDLKKAKGVSHRLGGSRVRRFISPSLVEGSGTHLKEKGNVKRRAHPHPDEVPIKHRKEGNGPTQNTPKKKPTHPTPPPNPQKSNQQKPNKNPKPPQKNPNPKPPPTKKETTTTNHHAKSQCVLDLKGGLLKRELILGKSHSLNRWGGGRGMQEKETKREREVSLDELVLRCGLR